MRKRRYVRNVVGYAAVTTLVWIGPSGVAWAQQNPTQKSASSDASRGELASFDKFLDSHREIAEQVRKNPSLVKDQKFVQSHPALETYYQQHPAVRQQLYQDPNAFMRQENRYDAREDARDMNRDRDANRAPSRGFDADRDRDRDRQQDANPQDADRRDADARRDYENRQGQNDKQNNNNPSASNRQDNNRPDSDANRQDADRRDADARRDYENYQGQDNNRNDDRREGREQDPNRGEIARFDDFLDRHHDIEAQLRRDPSLARNQQYLQNHPELQAYLQDHPGIREQLNNNPDQFMRREDRYETREDMNRDRGPNRGEIARFDDFLDRHHDVEEQLRRDPSLVRNQQYLQNHPDLQAYLQDHPGVRTQITNHPDQFMRREDRYEAREDMNRNDGRYDNRDNRNDNDRDRANRGELASFDRFLDSHREVAEQLRRDPSLARNQQFVANHPALQTYLQEHQGVREQIAANPNAFMHQENQFDRREDSMRGGQASFREFMGGHPSISADISRDPNKARDPNYMKSHPEFQAYLKAHPDVQTALNQDPHAYVKAAQQPATPPATSATKPGAGAATQPPDTKPPKP